MKSITVLTLVFLSFSAYCQLDVFDVARKGSIDQLKELVEINKDTINSINARGDSPLILACYYGNKEVAEYLIDNVNDVNYITPNGTALIAASYTKNKDIVIKLLTQTSNIDLVDQNGKSALVFAIMANDFEIVEILIKKGASTDLKDKSNKACIDYALESKNQKIIDLVRNS
jgi:uncharacterized protein